MSLKLTFLVAVVTVLAIGSIDGYPVDYSYVDATYSYYKFHKTPATWADAKSTCQSENDGSVLFHPEDEDELEQVLSKLGVGDNDGETLHTGLSDADRVGIYKTVEGHPLSQVYNKWRGGKPDYNIQNLVNKHCVHLNIETHALEIGSCEDVRRFICKYEKKGGNFFVAIHQAIAELKSTIAYFSHSSSIAIREQTESIKTQAANQSATLEQLVEKQTAVIEQLLAVTVQSENEVTAQKQAEDKQLAALEQLMSKQTAALDRQTLVLQKLQGSFPTFIQALHLVTAQIKEALGSNGLDLRSQQ